MRVQLYTVPGQVCYTATRKLVLQGADGVVFVADSPKSERDQTILASRTCRRTCATTSSDFKIPLVLQLNKRDLADAQIPLMPVERMSSELNRQLKAPAFPAAALSGMGVGKTLQECVKLVLKSLQQELNF